MNPEIKNPSLTKIRFLIYISGILFMLFFVFVNILQSNNQVYIFDYNNKSPLELAIPTNDSYKYIILNIKFNEDFHGQEFYNPKITQTLSVLTREKRATITQVEELRDKLFEKNNSSFPNGSILTFRRSLYLVENGKLRKFSSKKDFEKFGFKLTSAVEISKQEFKQFSLSEPISFEDRAEASFPKGLIIKSDNNFYLTRSNRISPIFSEALIQKVWPDCSFIEANSTDTKNMVNFDCAIMPDEQVVCEADLDKVILRNGDIFLLNNQGAPIGSIKKIDVMLKKSRGGDMVKNILDLLW